MWKMIRKMGFRLHRPRPRHKKSDPSIQEEFKRKMKEKVAQGKEIYFFDEARFGLQPTFTRLQSLQGKECYVEYQSKYKWIYLYSAV